MSIQRKILAGTVLLFSSSTVVNAVDGQINFTGKVATTGCQVSSSTASPQSVPLGTVSVASLGNTAGTLSGATTFNIAFSGCPAATTASTLKFSFTSSNGSTNGAYILNSAVTDPANGVGIALFDHKNKPITNNTSTSSFEIPVGSSSLDYSAAMVNTIGNGVTAGNVIGTATLTINY